MSAPPQLYVEFKEDKFDYELDWKEYIDNHSPQSTRFAVDAQSATVTGWIPANKKRSALKFFLGYSTYEDTAPYGLIRELPARHPEFPNLWAYDASFADVAPENQDVLDDIFNTGDRNHTDTPGTWKESYFTGSKDETMYYGGYQQCLMTVQYKSFGRMRFLPDADIAGDYTKEYQRYVMFGADPSMEALSADGASQLTFREGAPGPHTILGVTVPGKAFPAPVAELMGKTALTIRWFGVPHGYLSSDPDINLLDKIIGRFSAGDTPTNYSTWKFPPRIGTINKDSFLGYYPGTLLMKAVKVEEMMYPVTTTDPFEVAGGYNVTMVWEYFDPVGGVAFGPLAPLATPPTTDKRGHRLFPWRQDGLWYYATRENNTEMLPLTEHWKVFQNCNDPS